MPLDLFVSRRGLDWLKNGTKSVPLPNESAFGESEAFKQYLMQSINASTLPREVKEETRGRLLVYSGEDLKALQRRLLQAIAERPELIAKLVNSAGVQNDL
jgi:hypothetical protein